MGRSHTHQIVEDDFKGSNIREKFLPNRTATTWNLLPPSKKLNLIDFKIINCVNNDDLEFRDLKRTKKNHFLLNPLN
ncbi:hypothetical protein BpHYR1_002618 [Brachionus plicatilis]|uniref:Uncharacterized protein n=1 Tax=Brachionus plicatilis TaxID=10195 RepID=A0A3M7SEM6_BRAPC|nr:hypothetical protein BpHYR1_002618 [Brachionus plicatilis]